MQLQTKPQTCNCISSNYASVDVSIKDQAGSRRIVDLALGAKSNTGFALQHLGTPHLRSMQTKDKTMPSITSYMAQQRLSQTQPDRSNERCSGNMVSGCLTNTDGSMHVQLQQSSLPAGRSLSLTTKGAESYLLITIVRAAVLFFYSLQSWIQHKVWNEGRRPQSGLGCWLHLNPWTCKLWLDRQLCSSCC